MTRLIVWFSLACACLLLVGAMVRLFAPLPSLQGRQDHLRPSPTTTTTTLGRAVSKLTSARPGLSGFHLLGDGPSAFAARVLLLRAAEKSIDLQYYIWHDDLTGRLLFDEVRAAAQRGVRIRLLLDDNNSSGLDPLLKTLDDHPNIEVRLFNPFTVRKARTLGWAADFWRLNRRMHNKTFTVDGQVSIVGGRNIGDEYFGAAAGTLFVDLDTIAVGPIVANITTDFDRYWSSQSSYPASLLIRSTGQHPVTRSAPAQNAERQAYMKVVVVDFH